MKKYIAISEDLYSAAKKYAALNNCTTSEQVQYWAKVGKACIDNPDLPVNFIQDLLASLGANAVNLNYPLTRKSL